MLIEDEDNPISGISIAAEDFAIFKAMSSKQAKLKAMCVCHVDENGVNQYEWPNGQWR